MQIDTRALGPALRLLRSRRRLRQYQVADRAGITKAMLSSYEIGGVRPSIHSLTSLLAALETDLAGLQLALDVASGKAPPEVLRERDPAEEALEHGTEVLQILVPKLSVVLPLLERIARALEAASGLEEDPMFRRPEVRPAGGMRPYPRPR